MGPTGTDQSSNIGPGFAGFVVMFLLALAVVFLVRSMVGHLRKVRYSPDPNAAGGTSPTPVAGPAGTGAAAGAGAAGTGTADVPATADPDQGSRPSGVSST